MPAEVTVEQEMSGIPELGYWLEDSRETTRGCRSKVLKRFTR